MKITCPNCETAYKLADGALGATGRKVRCTRCGTVWHASPAVDPGPAPLDAAAARFREPSEDEWKAALADEEAVGSAASAGVAPHAGEEPDEAASAGNVVPFRPREVEGIDAPLGADPAAAPEEGPSTIDADPPGFEPAKRPKRPPKAPLRVRGTSSRMSAFASSVSLVSMATGFVVTVVLGSLVAREQVVQLIPDLAGLYRLVGLDVNLRGLEFRDVATTRELDGSTPVLVVEGLIANVEAEERLVPPLRFALQSAAGREVYAWTMDPPKESLAAGDELRFKSRLPAPPEAAVDVEVRFTDRRGP
jgi:predicted Zn finger-like uncharacterized protein